MELTPKQQATDTLRNAQSVLIVTHKNPDGDAVGSALALSAVLEKLNKKTTVHIPGELPEQIRFLPNIDKIKKSLGALNQATIAVNIDGNLVSSLGYRNDPSSGSLHIVLTLKDGELAPEDVSLLNPKQKFDAIIALDVPDLDRLGETYEQNAKLFYETPVINIDHHPSNDHFGKINWVDITATSTAEILVALIESLAGDEKLIDEDIATNLLTGIIYDTSSFQNFNTSPKSLTIAAQLVATGGRKDEIITNLYKTKSLSTLKLWGRVLSNIKLEKNYRFIWSFVTADDFKNLDATPSQTSGVIDELMKTANGADFAVLFCEKEDGMMSGSFRSIDNTVSVVGIAQALGGGGHEKASAFEARIESTFTESISEALVKIRQSQEERMRAIGAD